jgi:hypothetical protein
VSQSREIRPQGHNETNPNTNANANANANPNANAKLTFGSQLRGGLLRRNLLIRPIAPQQAELQVVTPNPTSTLPLRPRRCLNPLSLPPSGPGRPCHVHAVAVPFTVHIFPPLTT